MTILGVVFSTTAVPGAVVVQVYFSVGCCTARSRYTSALAGFAKVWLPAVTVPVPLTIVPVATGPAEADGAGFGSLFWPQAARPASIAITTRFFWVIIVLLEVVKLLLPTCSPGGAA